MQKITSTDINYWQTSKGCIVLCCAIAAFLFLPLPRDIIALTAAALLLTSRRMASRQMLGLVDWQLLVLFAALFIVNKVLETSDVLKFFMDYLAAWGIQADQPAWLFSLSVVLSNLVSNVPAVMLLLPAATHPLAGAILAIASTFGSNLLIIGSIATIIVIDQARSFQIKISWLDHARVGVPVTILLLAFAAGWLFLKSASPLQLYLIFK